MEDSGHSSVTIYHSGTLTSASMWSMDTFLTRGSGINIEKNATLGKLDHVQEPSQSCDTGL